MSKLTATRRRVSEIGWLSRQPLQFRDALLDRCVLRTYAPGENLYSLDDPPGGIYGLAEGFVDVLIASGIGPPFLGFIGGSGWWAGETAAITGTHRRADLRARSATEAFYLSLASFRELTATEPRAFRCFAELTVTHLDNALMLASTLAATNTRSRIISTLFRLAGSFRETDDRFELPCTQSEIAEMAGLSRNSAGPVLRGLETEGLIQFGRARVRYNPVHLRRALDYVKRRHEHTRPALSSSGSYVGSFAGARPRTKGPPLSLTCAASSAIREPVSGSASNLLERETLLHTPDGLREGRRDKGISPRCSWAQERNVYLWRMRPEKRPIFASLTVTLLAGQILLRLGPAALSTLLTYAVD